MWAGLLANIPSGWYLCDGTNGTPDLRDKFIKGCSAGVDPGGTGGAASVLYTPQGTNSGTAVSSHTGTAVADHPGHTHSVTSNVAQNVFTNPTIAWPGGVPTFSGSAGTVPAQTFTGTPFSSLINHTHTVSVTYNVQGGTTASTTGTHVMTSTATGGSARAPTSGDVVSATTANPSGGVSSITPAGTNSTSSFTPAGTVAWPAGVPTATGGSVSLTNNAVTSGGPSATLTHSVSQPNDHTVTQPTFTGTQASIATEPAYYRLAYIMKA